MISRRNVLSGLAASTAAGCSARQAPLAPHQVPVAPPPPDRASLGLDAVIDLSRFVNVSDFRLVRQSNILGVIHKATEGGDYIDPTGAAERPQSRAAGRGCCGAPIISGRGNRRARGRRHSSCPFLGPAPGHSWPSTSRTMKTD